MPSPSLRATECWTASKRPSGRCPSRATCSDSRRGASRPPRTSSSRGPASTTFCFGGYGSDSTDRAELTRCAIERAGRILGQRLDPQRILVVGDTPKDIEAARAVRAVAVGVASGNYGEAELREAGADYVLASLREPLPGLAAATVS